jgi:hypothetical protein
MLSVLFALSLLALVALTMLVLVAAPRASCCCALGVIIASALWCVYVCGDERGFTSGTNLNRILRDYDRMQQERAALPARSDWRDDGT